MDITGMPFSVAAFALGERASLWEIPVCSTTETVFGAGARVHLFSPLQLLAREDRQAETEPNWHCDRSCCCVNVRLARFFFLRALVAAQDDLVIFLTLDTSLCSISFVCYPYLACNLEPIRADGMNGSRT